MYMYAERIPNSVNVKGSCVFVNVPGPLIGYCEVLFEQSRKLHEATPKAWLEAATSKNCTRP